MSSLSSVLKPVLNSPINRSLSFGKYVYNFDGVDDRADLAFRAIDPEGDNTFEFYAPNTSGVARTIISQNISDTGTAREFHLYVNTSNGLEMIFGGTVSTLCSVAQGFLPNRKYFLNLIGNTYSVAKDISTNIISSGTFVRGTAREPTAITRIGARGAGVGVSSIFSAGLQYDVKINGVLYPMNSKDQKVLIPSPSGLGSELITPSVLTNPASVGNQWTYLGNGRWQYIGDGTSNVLQFIATASQPIASYLEFEVESISGTMRCFSNILNIGTNQSDPVFSTVGVKRWFILNKDLGSAGSSVTFSRQNAGVAASCIIKNISFKPLWISNATELVANGDFSSGTTGWSPLGSAGFTVTAGQASLTYSAGQNSRVERGVILEAGKYYQVSADVISITGVTNARLALIRGAAGAYATIGQVDATNTGKISFVILSSATDTIISMKTGDTVNSGTVVWDNLSVRKLDSVCNLMQMFNTTTDRWVEISQ